MREYHVQREQSLVEYLLQSDVGLRASTLSSALRKKDVKVNGVRVKQDVKVYVGDCVQVYLPECEFVLPYDVLYEDENVLVVDKHKAITSEALAETLAKGYGARAVHRLDYNTAGLMVFAKNAQSEKELLFAFKHRTVHKIYLAEVFGEMESAEGEYNDYLVKDAAASRVKIYSVPVRGGVAVRTGWRVCGKGQYGTLLYVTLYTGKTHQIRAHLAYHGHFIIGDSKYGKQTINRATGQKSQRLYAAELRFDFKQGVLSYLNGKTFYSNLAKEQIQR